VLATISALTWLYVVICVLSALGLIFLILMHSGKGGGLSDMFGGSVGAAAQGSTVVERNLDRITVTVAIIFAFSVITLDLRLQ
jgi:preprotein translocase subunit SecG